MIPKIEDGNNFGVSIQEDTLAEIQSVESEAAAFFDQISRYFISRAKIVSKVAKYPHIEDYRRAVQVTYSYCTIRTIKLGFLNNILILYRSWMRRNSLVYGLLCAKYATVIPHSTTLLSKIWKN